MGDGRINLKPAPLRAGPASASRQCVVELHTKHTAKLVADLPTLMWGADTEGRTTFVSEALLRAAGYEEDELTGGPLSELLVGDDGAVLSGNVARQLLAGERRLPLRLRTRDGATYRIAWERLPKRDRDGRLIEVVGVARELLPALDTDPLRDAQLDLFDAARMCIIGMRPDGLIVYVNGETEDVLGSTPCSGSASRCVDEAALRRVSRPGAAQGALVGRNYFALLAPSDDGAAWHSTKDHIEACLGAHDYETTILAGSGRRVVMRWSSAPFRPSAHSTPELIFLFGLDVTEERRREREEHARSAIAALAGVSLSFEAYFSAVQHHLAPLMSFDAAAVVRADGASDTITPLLASGAVDDAEHRLLAAPEIVRAAIRDLRPYAYFGPSAAADGTMPVSAEDAEGAYIVLPLVADGAPLGAFVLTASGADAFGERDVAFLETIAPDLARAFQVHLLRDELGAMCTAHRVLFEQAQEGALMLDAEFRCVEANASARRILGMPGLKAVGRPVDELLAAEDARALRRKLHELGRTSGCALDTFTLRREGAGGRIEVEAFAARSNNEILVLIEDVTNRNQARRELVEHERALGWLARGASDGVALVKNGRLEQVNEALLALFGYRSAGELTGRLLEVLYAPGEFERVAKDGERLAARHTFAGRKRDGSILRIEASAITFGDDAPAALLVLRDTGTDEQIERHMHRSAQTAGLAEIAGNVAHGFNGALVTILGSTTLARSFQPDDPRHSALLAGIRDAASRAAELTSELLAASRGGAYAVEPVSLNQTVTDTLSMLKACLPRDVRVTTDLLPDLPTVEGDPYQFTHVVLQVVLNALEAMPGGGDLAVSTGIYALDEGFDPDRPDVRPGRYVRLVVSDTGPGMDHETLRRVCEPFFSTKGADRGLGMAAARSIVTRHNGYLALTSSPGDGTEVEVLLPTHWISQQPEKRT